MTDHADVPIRAAATVVLLRDGADGLETFQLRRNRATVFGPGHYVFPGGAVDDADTESDLVARCDGLDDAEASRRIGVSEGGISFWIAAVRECFEECGLLLATDSNGSGFDRGRDLAAERVALNDGTLDFAALCHRADLRFPMNRLFYYTQWITPVGAPRRFATRFFACAAPRANDGAVHDGAETVAGGWVTPAAALAEYHNGDRPMMPPTVTQLLFLSDFADVASALAAIAVVDVVARGPRLRVDVDG